jgi:hypothetical protein
MTPLKKVGIGLPRETFATLGVDITEVNKKIINFIKISEPHVIFFFSLLVELDSVV